jgi:hypothetical protein
LVTFLTFDMPPGYGYGLAFLTALALVTMALDVMTGVQLPQRERFLSTNFMGSPEAVLARAMALFILLFCVLDLTLFPIPLISDPTQYATFDGGRNEVRHISNMVWVLPVVGLTCYRSRFIKLTFILASIAFPILVLDRNRLFASIIAVVMVMILYRRRAIPWKTLIVLGVLSAALFSFLGSVRSGTLAWLTLPFSDIYNNAPEGVKWLLLYVGAGIYNFSSILAKGYVNATFLINQLVPGAGSTTTIGTDIPFDSITINVGTEYFPFLMALGIGGAMVAALVLYIGLNLSILLLRWRISPFTLLVFLRLSYVCIMASFAPQAFIWTNFAFIILCLGMMAFAALLPRKMSTPTQA